MPTWYWSSKMDESFRLVLTRNCSTHRATIRPRRQFRECGRRDWGLGNGDLGLLRGRRDGFAMILVGSINSSSKGATQWLDFVIWRCGGKRTVWSSTFTEPPRNSPRMSCSGSPARFADLASRFPPTSPKETDVLEETSTCNY